uniref:Uncharacterized protein n=1 Tax=viral metagenome TaxID=1070528 RepID=A0A6C0IFG9_9ZZZZ
MHKNGTKKNIKISNKSKSNKSKREYKGQKSKSTRDNVTTYNKTFRNFKPKCYKKGKYILDEINRFKQMTQETKRDNNRRASARKKDK